MQIYTDWANHYLQRGRHKRLITDLQQDIADGVLLAEVIEAVSKFILYGLLSLLAGSGGVGVVVGWGGGGGFRIGFFGTELK